jgi:hypothetical protein
VRRQELLVQLHVIEPRLANGQGDDLLDLPWGATPPVHVAQPDAESVGDLLRQRALKTENVELPVEHPCARDASVRHPRRLH